MAPRADEIGSRVYEVRGRVAVDLCGELTMLGATRVHRLLTKLLLDRGHVLVDVSRLRVGWKPALAVFPAALAETGGWPLARMVLVGADPPLVEALRAVKVPRQVPLAATWDQAECALATRPEHIRRSFSLPAQVEAAVIARVAVREICADWELEPLTDLANLVATELVTNAVQHARTSSHLSLTRTPLGLHVAVRDWLPVVDADLCRFVASPPGAHGLLLVDALTRHWGISRHADGKTVWAVLSTTDPLAPLRPEAD